MLISADSLAQAINHALEVQIRLHGFLVQHALAANCRTAAGSTVEQIKLLLPQRPPARNIGGRETHNRHTSHRSSLPEHSLHETACELPHARCTLLFHLVLLKCPELSGSLFAIVCHFRRTLGTADVFAVAFAVIGSSKRSCYAR